MAEPYEDLSKNILRSQEQRNAALKQSVAQAEEMLYAFYQRVQEGLYLPTTAETTILPNAARYPNTKYRIYFEQKKKALNIAIDDGVYTRLSIRIAPEAGKLAITALKKQGLFFDDWSPLYHELLNRVECNRDIGCSLIKALHEIPGAVYNKQQAEIKAITAAAVTLETLTSEKPQKNKEAQPKTAAQSQELNLGEVIDGYTITEHVATGGCGYVYAVESATGVKKIMKVPRNDVGKESLERELATAKNLKHKNILPIEHVNLESKTPYLLMPYVPELESFDNLVAKLPRDQKMDVLRQVAEALEYAHRAKVLHCDIKPANILVTKNLDVLLADFGLATIDPRKTAEHEVGEIMLSGKLGDSLVRGTWSYLAPEVARGEFPTIKSDLYSFAMTCFEGLVGRLPYPGENVQRTLSRNSISEKQIKALVSALDADYDYRAKSVAAFSAAFFETDAAEQAQWRREGAFAEQKPLQITKTETSSEAISPAVEPRATEKPAPAEPRREAPQLEE